MNTVPDTMNVSVAVPATIDSVHYLPDRPNPGEQEHDGDEARVPERPHCPHQIEYQFKLQIQSPMEWAATAQLEVFH